MKLQKRALPHAFACYEIQLHYKRPVFDKSKSITSSESAEEILRAFADADRISHKEFFWAIFLSNANQILGISEIGVGTHNSVFVDIKEIFQLALLTNASAILVAHNHPSGKLKPSEADLKFTKKLNSALDVLNITLLDHIILTSESYTSFSDDGKL